VDTIPLQDSPAFYTSMQAKKARPFAVTMHDLRVPAVGLTATVLEEPIIQPEFGDLFAMFSEDEARYLADYGLQDYVINLQEAKLPPRGPKYNLHEQEL
jgi:hypothetical protein